MKTFISSLLLKQRTETAKFENLFDYAEFHDMIDEMWIDCDKTKYETGWNSALAELEAKLIIKEKK